MVAGEQRGSQSEPSGDGTHPAGGLHSSPVVASTLELRGATAADLPALIALEAQFPGDRLSRRQFRFHLGSPRARLRLAIAEQQVLGYALLLLHAQRGAARLYSIAVDPGQRGRGIGAALLADAEAQARAAGRSALTLEVREDNAAALALYRARGYRLSGRKPGYYDDGMAALCLRRILPPNAG